jgi:hypothetical protein
MNFVQCNELARFPLVSFQLLSKLNRRLDMRKLMLFALASAVIAPAAASAHPGGGNGGGEGRGGLMGGGSGIGMDPSSRGMGGLGGIGDVGVRGANANADDVGVENREASRINSRAPQHASPTGISHANQNSVLAGTSSASRVTNGALAGLTTGTTLFSNGTAVGTVQQIRTRGNGSVAVVIVKGTNGGLYALPANKLSLSGGTLMTTVRLNGINGSTNVAMNSQARLNSQGPANASATGIAHANSHSVLAGAAANVTPRGSRRANSQGPAHASATGIAHANSRSVLAGASTSRLTGVSVGMPLFSNGTQVGTVTRVITANGVITRVLAQGMNGRIYSFAPSQLTATAGSVTTTRTLRGM